MPGVQVMPMIIHLYPDSLLSQKCNPVISFGDHLDQACDQLINLMYLRDGVGIAAPQGGLSARICIVDIGDGPLRLINPEYKALSSETYDSNEGCLSFPGIEATHIKRWKTIEVKAKDVQGNEFIAQFEEHNAAIIQHEIDHLDGITIIDKVGKVQKDLLLKKYYKNLKRIKLYNELQEKLKNKV